MGPPWTKKRPAGRAGLGGGTGVGVGRRVGAAARKTKRPAARGDGPVQQGGAGPLAAPARAQVGRSISRAKGPTNDCAAVVSAHHQARSGQYRSRALSSLWALNSRLTARRALNATDAYVEDAHGGGPAHGVTSCSKLTYGAAGGRLPGLQRHGRLGCGCVGKTNGVSPHSGCSRWCPPRASARLGLRRRRPGETRAGRGEREAGGSRGKPASACHSGAAERAALQVWGHGRQRPRSERSPGIGV